MMLQEVPIEERLSQRKVVETLDSIVYSLQLLKPNGMTVHTVRNIIFGLRGHKQLAKFRYPQDLTFSQYKETFSHSYRSIITGLTKAKNYVPI